MLTACLQRVHTPEDHGYWLSRLAFLLWHSCCGIPGVAFLLWHSCCGIPGVAFLLWHSWCGIPGCGIPGVAFLLWHSWCGIPVVTFAGANAGTAAAACCCCYQVIRENPVTIVVGETGQWEDHPDDAVPA